MNLRLRNKLSSAMWAVALAMTVTASSAQTLTFGVFSAPPWGQHTATGVTGITVDHIEAILERAGYDLAISFTPYPRMMKELHKGEIDCVIATKNPRSEGKVNYLSALYTLDVSVVSHKDQAYISDEALFTKASPAVVGFANGTGHFYSPLYHSEQLDVQLLAGHSQAPGMLAKRRIDAFVGIERLLLFELRKAGVVGEMYFPGYRVNKLDMWLQCSRHAAHIAEYGPKLRKAAQTLKEEKRFSEILNTWIPELQAKELK